MLDSTKIPLGRLAVAYGLSDNEMKSVIETFGATFDYAWMNAEYNFIYPGLELFSQYDKEKLTVIIEEIFQADELYYHARAEGFMLFVAQSCGSIFDYQELLRFLSDMRIRAEENLSDPERTERMLKDLYRDKLLLAVRDMCLVDKKSAVIFLENHDLHLQQEAKGLSRQFVEEVLNEMKTQISIPQQQPTAESGRIHSPADVDGQIKEWTVILPKLRGSDATAAKLAIEKWRGKPHAEAYRAAIPDGNAHDPKAYVSAMRVTAEKVAKTHGLPMPSWHSKT